MGGAGKFTFFIKSFLANWRKFCQFNKRKARDFWWSFSLKFPRTSQLIWIETHPSTSTIKHDFIQKNSPFICVIMKGIYIANLQSFHLKTSCSCIIWKCWRNLHKTLLKASTLLEWLFRTNFLVVKSRFLGFYWILWCLLFMVPK